MGVSEEGDDDCQDSSLWKRLQGKFEGADS